MKLLHVEMYGLVRKSNQSLNPGGGGVLPMMAYTGQLHPKVVSFSGFRYMKG